MATAKSVKKTAVSGKRAAAPTVVSAAKSKPVPRAKPAVKPEPVAKVPPKAGAKAALAKAARPRAKKPATVAAEQRRNYIEVAAYHIAERRGFAPGDPLQDWVQAEAEIDRLIAEGRLGG